MSKKNGFTFRVLISLFFVFALGIVISRMYPMYVKDDEHTYDQTVVHAATPIEQDPTTVTYLPVTIEIPSVDIKLEVERGSYDPNTEMWTLGEGEAYWADLTTLPSQEPGNTLIYAHNQPNAFYRLKDIEKGDKIVITAETGEHLVYEYQHDKIVDPRDNELFDMNDDTYLTLLTCNGWFSEARRLMIAKLVEITE